MGGDICCELQRSVQNAAAAEKERCSRVVTATVRERWTGRPPRAALGKAVAARAAALHARQLPLRLTPAPAPSEPLKWRVASSTIDFRDHVAQQLRGL